jgi:glucose-6-phosphate isomerase
MTVAADGGAAAAGGVSVAWHSTATREAAGQAAGKLIADGVPSALAARDPGLWGGGAGSGLTLGPGAGGPASLGWLDAPRASRALLGSLAVLASRAREDGLDHVVLAGMGGSSLAPEVISRTSGLPLTLLETTDPHPVARALGDRLEHTLVVVSSKSGSTIETDSHRRIYERAFAGLGLAPHEIAQRFVVVTDPGSPLEQVAHQAGYHVVLADPNVTGCYSALTAFGLVPTALAGADAGRLLDEADAVLTELAFAGANPGLDLGAALGGYALAGHDKMVLADCGSGLAGFGDWAEQLIAESTGKDGQGILPVVVADEDAPGYSPGPDTHLVALGAPAGPVDTSVAGPLGAQFLIWEYAAAVAARLLGVNPFAYPGVVAAKQETARLLAGAGPPPAGVPAFTEGAVDVYAEPGLVPASGGLAEVLDTLLLALPDRGYLAVMAYLDRDGDRAVTAVRDALAARTTHPVTFGWGPRLLHSTGQYHKGGPQNGVFLQITGALEDDVDVPGRDFTLGGLQLAQALGDLGALRQRGRPAIRIHLRDRAAGVSQLLDSARASTNGAAP